MSKTSLLIAVCILAAALAGCRSAGFGSEQTTNVTTIPIGSTATTIPASSTTTIDDQSTKYLYISWDVDPIDTVEQLVEESEFIFLGTIESISFSILDHKTGKVIEPDSNQPIDIENLYTIYEISIKTNLKGEETDTVYLALDGGIKNYREDEQRALLAAYGLPDTIVLHNTSTQCIIGEEYLFTLRHEDGWENYLEGTNAAQVAYHNVSFNPRYSPLYNKILVYYNMLT